MQPDPLPRQDDAVRPRCDECRYPEAIQEDYERYEAGEGEHLCWGDPSVCAMRVEEGLDDRDRYRKALEEALEWVPEPERTTLAGVLR